MIEPSQGCMLLGAYRVATSLTDCVVLVHGPTGCHFGPNFLEVAGDNMRSAATASVMRERCIIYGGVENLENVIAITRKHHVGKKIVVLSSCAPAIIGDDVESEDIDIYLDCGGFQTTMWQGMEAFLEKLGEVAIQAENRSGGNNKDKDVVNIIGFQSDVAGARQDIEEIVKIFPTCNVNVIPDSYNNSEHVGDAILNIVFGYGVKLAKMLEKEFGTPYIVVDYPYGVHGWNEFMQTVREYCKVDYDDQVNYGMKRYRGNLPLFYDVPVCVVGDLPRISGMCKFLERELGMNVELAHATSMCMEEFDVPCTTLVEESQNEFRDKVNEIDFKMLFGTDGERWIRNDTIVFSFPSFTRMSFTPYLGNGTLNLISDIYDRLVMYGFGNNR